MDTNIYPKPKYNFKHENSISMHLHTFLHKGKDFSADSRAFMNDEDVILSAQKMFVLEV